MEIYFLDVGQATCQVILLGNSKAIVVDCGVSDDRTVLRFLKQMRVDSLAALITSHSHDDHIGGALNVLGEYQSRIEKIAFIEDAKFLQTRYWARLNDLYSRRVLTADHFFRLECTAEPQVIWEDQATGTSLRTHSPSAIENVISKTRPQKENATSAVLVLRRDGERIAFCADSQIDQWKELVKRQDAPIRCRILSVPHHAGRTMATTEDLEWLYQTVLQPEVAVVSVGTFNPHGHPRDDVMAALRAAGAKVMCTQITAQCCKQLTQIAPGLLHSNGAFGKSSFDFLRTSEKAGEVGCAGSVRVDWGIGSPPVIVKAAEHQAAIDRMIFSCGATPLCR